MVILRNKHTKKEIKKNKIQAQAILNNPVFGSDWSVVKELKDTPAPPEVEKVSIADDVKKKTTKKNNAD